MANNTSSNAATGSRMAAIRVPCCLCGTMTFPNKNANQQCATCLAQNKYDLKSELQKGPGGAPHPTIYQCRTCKRYQRTPTLYEACEPESPELLSICLKHLPALNNSNKKYKVKKASWIRTEPHSMRFKVKLSVHAVVDNLMVVQRVMVHHPAMVHQEDVMVELYCAWKQCPDIRRPLFNSVNDGMINSKREIGLQQAQMFSNYLREVAPLKISTSQKEVVVSTNSRDNNTTANRKHPTITCEMVPLCVQDLVVVDKTTCKNNKLAGQLILILKVVKAVVHAISASPPRSKIGDSLVEISPDAYFKYEESYRILQSSTNHLVRFVVLDVELCETTTTDTTTSTTTRPPDTYYDDEDDDKKKKKKYNNNNNNSSSYYALADVQVVRENDMASNEVLCCVSHLGHVLQAGDIVLGYDLSASTYFGGGADWGGANLNHQFVIPDVVLVKKVAVSKKGNKKEDSIDDETDHQSHRLDSKPKLSKKKQRRRRRKENKKMKDLEERVERMGFLEEEEEENDNDFEAELEEDPEMAEQLQALEDDFAKLDKEQQQQQQQQKKDQSRGQKEQQQQEQKVDDEEENDGDE